jgi:hypothetical protein
MKKSWHSYCALIEQVAAGRSLGSLGPSWAQAMLVAIQLKAPFSWRKAFILGAVANPKEIQGMNNGNAPRSNCSLL